MAFVCGHKADAQQWKGLPDLTGILREKLSPLNITLTTLGRGLSTGSELEYSDAETLSGALLNRKET